MTGPERPVFIGFHLTKKENQDCKSGPNRFSSVRFCGFNRSLGPDFQALCVRHYFQLTRSEVSMEATKRIRSIYLPCSCFNLAAYWACNFSSDCNYIKKNKLAKKKNLLVFASFWRGFAFSSVWVQCQICSCSTGEKNLPIWVYFLMLCCFASFAFAIDTVLGFLPGGPTLKAVCVDFPCERLDFEEDE